MHLRHSVACIREHVRLGERERECVCVFERETHIRSDFDVSFM